MANTPNRRTSSSYPLSTHHNYHLPISDVSSSDQFQNQTATTLRLLNSLKIFLKKPHAFPFLLSIFLLLTWVSLRFTHTPRPSADFNALNAQLHDGVKDSDANVVRFQSTSSIVAKDGRGWLIDPVSLALHADFSGAATICRSIHVGEIKPDGMRGNHRHHTCNETFVIWGAKTLYRVENEALEKGYAEVTIGAEEVAVASQRFSPCLSMSKMIMEDCRISDSFWDLKILRDKDQMVGSFMISQLPGSKIRRDNEQKVGYLMMFS